jgi:hypothetical protein
MAEPVEKSELQVAPVVTHNEELFKKDNEIILKSSFDKLGLWATVRRFWKVYNDLGLGRICAVIGILMC